MKLVKLGTKHAETIFQHQAECYPAAMCEGLEVFERLLRAEMSFGFLKDENLIAWVLFEPVLSRHAISDGEKIAYCYDLAVLPTYRHRGYAKSLWVYSCQELRFEDYWISAHCRRTSYRLIATAQSGYERVLDEFIENHYAKEYEDDSLIGEHAREILLKPVPLL